MTRATVGVSMINDKLRRAIALLACLALSAICSAQTLDHRTSWLGNTFGNADNRWVQNRTTVMALGEDGTIYAHAGWDEAGRCLGAYKNGTVDPRMFQQYDGRGGHKAWGWGTSGRSVAVSPDHVFIINARKDLIRFRRSDHKFDAEMKVEFAPRNMAWHNGVLFVLDHEKPVLHQIDAKSLKLTDSRQLSTDGHPADLAVDRQRRIWLSYPESGLIEALDADSHARVAAIEDAGVPRALHVGHDGRLVVCDTGPRSQVRLYDVSKPQPKLVEAFGEEGGLSAKPAGVVEGRPKRLFALVGASTDAKGNLYVAMSDHMNILRQYTPARELAWEVMTTCFVDAANFAPGSDGEIIYGREEIYHYDYDEPDPAKAWTLHALTRDPHTQGKDVRTARDGKASTNAWVRQIGDRRVLFTTGMHADRLHVLPFDDPKDSTFARDHGQTIGSGWALWVDARGQAWSAAKGEIRMHRAVGVEGDTVRFDEPKTWRYPAPMVSVNRLIYDAANDRMFLGGFTSDRRDPKGAWGLVGTEVVRFDNWSDQRRLVSRAILPFETREGGASQAMIMPKAMDVAGDYLFVVYVWADGQSGAKPPVKVFRTRDGSFVGDLRPGRTIGGRHGWVDIPYALSAMRRANGEYVVLVEEDGFAKITMYRWTPDADKN